MARPAKLTSELTQKITTYICDGNSPTTSATLAGISPSTYFNWMSKGANQEPGFLEFSESIERAKAQSIINRVAYISKAADSGHWRAAAWLLERMAPQSFGKNSTKAQEISTQQLERHQGVSIQKLEESIEKILENRSQQQSNSIRKFMQPTQTKEIRGK
jgi:hypothetical protein